MFRSFAAAILGTAVGIASLALGTLLVFGLSIYFQEICHHILFLGLFSGSLIAAEATWATILRDRQFAARAVKATAFALITGFFVVASVSIFMAQFVPSPYSNDALWLIVSIAGSLGSAAAGATWGRMLGGRKLACRAALASTVVTAPICIFPLTFVLLLYFQSLTIFLAYIPFLVCSVVFGRTIFQPPIVSPAERENSKATSRGGTAPD
jgi:hypothetical protein